MLPLFLDVPQSQLFILLMAFLIIYELWIQPCVIYPWSVPENFMEPNQYTVIYIESFFSSLVLSWILHGERYIQNLNKNIMKIENLNFTFWSLSSFQSMNKKNKTWLLFFVFFATLNSFVFYYYLIYQNLILIYCYLFLISWTLTLNNIISLFL